jgi:hypothetical protein
MTATTNMQALQKSIYDVLAADSTLMTLLSNHLYDRVPEGLNTNAITVLSFHDVSALRSHLSAHTAEKITLTMKCVSRSGSRKTVLDVVERVVTLLDNAALTLSSGAVQLISLRVDRISVSPDKNGVSHSGSVSVSAWVSA